MKRMIFPIIHIVVTLFFINFTYLSYTLLWFMNVACALYCGYQIIHSYDHQNQPDYFVTNPAFIWAKISVYALLFGAVSLLFAYPFRSTSDIFLITFLYPIFVGRNIIKFNRDDNFTFDLRWDNLRIYQINKLIFAASHGQFTYHISFEEKTVASRSSRAIQREYYQYVFCLIEPGGKLSRKVAFTCNGFDETDLYVLTRSLDKIAYAPKEEDAPNPASPTSAANPGEHPAAYGLKEEPLTPAQVPMPINVPLPINNALFVNDALSGKKSSATETSFSAKFPATRADTLQSLPVSPPTSLRDTNQINKVLPFTGTLAPNTEQDKKRVSMTDASSSSSKASAPSIKDRPLTSGNNTDFFLPPYKAPQQKFSKEAVAPLKKRKPLFTVSPPATGKIADIKKALKNTEHSK